MGYCVRSLFCYAVLCVLSSFVIISLGKRELVALLYSHVVVVALCLFLTVPWVGLQCVIVAFPGHTHLLFGGNHYYQSDSLTYTSLGPKTGSHYYSYT